MSTKNFQFFTLTRPPLRILVPRLLNSGPLLLAALHLGKKRWCPRWDSNPQSTREHDFESCAYTSSATWAICCSKIVLQVLRLATLIKHFRALNFQPLALPLIHHQSIIIETEVDDEREKGDTNRKQVGEEHDQQCRHHGVKR